MKFMPRHALALLAGLCAGAAALAADGPVAAAARLWEAHQNTQAEAALLKVLAARPDDTEANYYLGEVSIDLNKVDQAVSCLERAVKAAPDDARIQHALGDAYGLSALKAGMFSKLTLARRSAAAYARAVELDPLNAHYHWSYLDFCRQAPSIAGGGLDRAYAEAEALRRIDAALGLVAEAELKADEKKFDEAFRALDAIPPRQTDTYGALYQRGRLAALSGQRIDAGIAALKRCLELEPTDTMPEHAPVEWRLGNLYEAKGDVAAARDAYRAVLHLDPGFAPASDALGKLSDKGGS